MFENPRRGRQARNFKTNVPKILVLKSSSEQIFSRKLPLGAPEKTDVVFLQETHSKKETEVQWKNEWGGEILFSYGSPNSYGTAKLIRNNANYSVLSTTRFGVVLLY